MILHGYWRSGTSYRTRIALNLKKLEYRQAPLDLRTGAQKSEAYLRLNPQGLVPALETDDGLVLTQSPAILEWLEETHPEPPLLPSDAAGRAQVRAMAALIGCDIHPLNNLRVLKAVRGLTSDGMGADQTSVDAWAGQWIIDGFTALETLVVRHGDGWCFGGAPTLADCYLIPQLYSARRFHVDLAAFPRLLEIEARAEVHPAFIAALPENQPDAD
ncbi:maleylacetoacetate isomerase [Brevundimonas naejangsanensis]|jgi:maleylacetoacetate isomerase|uniref:maleylacetoacetate isomerase n=1 Tax=Brevundimonas naejangsanensis TaxID=588932 RepID=UPI00106B53D9|nr:maleylacetoacetate isomerase [Brevundimonas naejangsanensis]QBQ49478.1 maleylacetoacetate isomerase [Brevundimonas naejangsanensis]